MREIIWDAASIGFGVQSTAIALMAGLDMIPRPDAYYFSHLRETKATEDYIGYIRPKLIELGVNVQFLSKGDLYNEIMSWETASRVSMIPVWFMGKNGKRQPLNRQCTSDWKIEVVASAIRSDLNKSRLKRNEVRVWQGITTDEIGRAKRRPLFSDNFRVNHYPFIAQYANITYPTHNWESYSRNKIIELFQKLGIKVPPKSSCFFCPYHDIMYWYDIYINEPDNWELACKLDDSIRNYNTQSGILEAGPFYLYEGLIPLREIDFDKEIAKLKTGQFELSDCNSGFCMM